MSPITAWELSLASQKPKHKDPPRLGTPIKTWFRDALQATSAKIAPVSARIAIAAAEVPILMAHKDPGDCYIIATAQVKNVPVITRDGALLRLATAGHLLAIGC